MMQNNLLKVRCSGLSDVSAYLDNPELPDGAITYLNDWLKEKRYKRRKSFKAKETTKGIIVEDESIDLIMLKFDTGLITKNTERKTNNYITGEADIICQREGIIIDAKNSWGLSQFPMFNKELPKTDKKYISQVKGYLELWDMPKGYIAYCLMDCPTFMIKDAIQKEIWAQQKENPDIFDLTYDETIDIVHKMVFTIPSYQQVCRELKIDRSPEFIEIPEEDRVKSFEVLRDNSFIEKINNRVDKMNELLSTDEIYSKAYNYLLNKKQENERTN